MMISTKGKRDRNTIHQEFAVQAFGEGDVRSRKEAQMKTLPIMASK